LTSRALHGRAKAAVRLAPDGLGNLRAAQQLASGTVAIRNPVAVDFPDRYQGDLLVLPQREGERAAQQIGPEIGLLRADLNAAIVTGSASVAVHVLTSRDAR
jgi:hypothetical protein